MYLITGENVYNIFCIERRKHNARDMALKESNLDYTDNTEGYDTLYFNLIVN
jgi:hypothetical protein